MKKAANYEHMLFVTCHRNQSIYPYVWPLVCLSITALLSHTRRHRTHRCDIVHKRKPIQTNETNRNAHGLIDSLFMVLLY